MIFGHIGDAHVHVNILSKSDEELERAKETMVELAVRRWRWAARCRRNMDGNARGTCWSCSTRRVRLSRWKDVERGWTAWILAPGNIFAV